MQSIVNTAAQVEPISNPYPSQVIDILSPTDPRIRPADQSSDKTLVLDQQNSNFG